MVPEGLLLVSIAMPRLPAKRLGETVAGWCRGAAGCGEEEIRQQRQVDGGRIEGRVLDGRRRLPAGSPAVGAWSGARPVFRRRELRPAPGKSRGSDWVLSVSRRECPGCIDQTVGNTLMS